MTTSSEQGVAERRTRIPRARLAKRIASTLESGSVLLVAEAGFGKTMILDEALPSREEGGVAWVTCTVSDRDAGRLLLRVIEALHRAAPGAADVLGERLTLAVEQVDPIAATRELAAELGRLLVDPVILVLDDAEQLAGAPALAVAEELLRADMRLCRVALASRTWLPLRLAKLRAAGRLTSFGNADLAFGVDECADFLRARHGVEPEADEVEALMSATEGWPLGVALGALSRSGDAALAYSLRSREEVYAFLAEEVLDPLEPRQREAVIDSSVPHRLTPAIVEALKLPAGFLEDIERIGLFVRVSEGEDGLRYHPLFREFLLARLRAARSGARREQLHAMVAPAVAAEGHTIEAIEHWLEAGYWPEVVAGLEREGPGLLRTAPESLRAWIARLPDEHRGEPAIRLLEGQLEWGAGDFRLAAEHLRGAIAGYRWHPDPMSEWLARFTLSDALFSTGELEEAAQVAEGFDAPEAEAAGILPAATAVYGATALASMGRIEESDELAARAVAGERARELAPLESLRRAFIDTPAGRLSEARARVEAALAHYDDSDPFQRRPYLMASLAMMFTDEGREEEAIEWWGRAGEAGRGGVAPFLAGTSHIYRALLHAQAGRLAEAEAEMTVAGTLDLATWRDYHRDLARAAIASLRGDAPEAVAAVDRALSKVAPGPVLFRFWTAADAVPILVRAGDADRARAVVEETLSRCEEALPGEQGAFLRSRLLALRAWLCTRAGEEKAANEHLRRFWEDAGEASSHIIRREWPRLERLLWSALEHGVLDSGEVVRAIGMAWPEGTALLPFTEHPVAQVRRAALSPAVASGHPAAMARLRDLARDPDKGVATAARAAADGLATTAPPLIFTLLGGFEVRRGAWLVDDAAWERPMATRLVRFLLVNRDAIVPEDLIFEAFWPEKSAAAARRGLQVAVSRARAVLDPPGAEESVLEVIERSYRLRLGEQDIVDVDEFEAAAEAALAERGQARRALLERARDAWRGEPLPEDRYSEWSVAWRERLVDRYIEVLAGLAEAYTAAGDYAAAIEAAREVVALDPANESAHRDLMAAYARAGRTGHALRQFLECRRALVDELGIEPSDETSRLQARILAGEPL